MLILLIPDAESQERLDNLFQSLARGIPLIARGLVDIAHDDVVDDIAQNFSEEGMHGRKWADLAPRTQAERAMLGFPPDHPILFRTGSLLESLTVGAVTVFQENGGDATFRMGTDDERFEELQEGRPDMPARHMVSEYPEDKVVLCTTIEEDAVAYVERMAKEVFDGRL